MLYAIKHTKTGLYYSPKIDGTTQWMPKELAYTYPSFDWAAVYSQAIETDDFNIVAFEV